MLRGGWRLCRVGLGGWGGPFLCGVGVVFKLVRSGCWCVALSYVWLDGLRRSMGRGILLGRMQD